MLSLAQNLLPIYLCSNYCPRNVFFFSAESIQNQLIQRGHSQLLVGEGSFSSNPLNLGPSYIPYDCLLLPRPLLPRICPVRETHKQGNPMSKNGVSKSRHCNTHPSTHGPFLWKQCKIMCNGSECIVLQKRCMNQLKKSHRVLRLTTVFL